MRRYVVLTMLLTLAVAVSGVAAPVQVTASLDDSRLQRFGPKSTGLAVLLSQGDLTPGLPGNLDGSREVFLLEIATSNQKQVTSSNGGSSSSNVSELGLVVIGSRQDLTPGAPGNTDGSFEVYIYDVDADTLTQVTNTADDTFFQTYYNDGENALFVSKGDLTPGAPGNTDGENEVYSYDFGTRAFTQLTSSAYESLVRGVDPESAFAVIESEADLTPGAPGNADHDKELYLYDLETTAVTQLTNSPMPSILGGVSRDGRWIAIISQGDLMPADPGNADGSYEFFLYDTRSDGMKQVTNSMFDSIFAGFDPRSKRAAIESQGELDPGGLGNADGTYEIFTYHLIRERMTQVTDSDGDCWFEGFEPKKGKWVAIRSDGDLAPGAPGNTDGSQEIYFSRLKKSRRENTFHQATDGLEDVSFGGWSVKGRYAAVDTTANLKNRNTDGSREVYILRARFVPKVTQVTDSLSDSFVGGFAPDKRTLFIHSYGDLDPTGPGNADGSMEVFTEQYR